MSGGRGVRSDEAVAGYRAGVGDVFADAAEPAAVAFACVWGRDRFDEVAQVLAGIRGSAAVTFVLFRCGLDDLGGDGLDRAVICRVLAGGAVLEAAWLGGPWREAIRFPIAARLLKELKFGPHALTAIRRPAQ